jgi:putative ABC transport system substrate-binding protein
VDPRAFLGTVAGSLLALPLAVEAQQAGKMLRIGVIVPVEPASRTEPNIGAFRLELRDLGYLEGQNVAVEYLYAHGQPELYPELVAGLIRLEVDVIVVGNPIPTLVAKHATQAIPIVGVGMGADPSARVSWRASSGRVATSRDWRG